MTLDAGSNRSLVAARAAGPVLAGLVLVLGAACSTGSFEPEPLAAGKAAPESRARTFGPTPESATTPSAGPTPVTIDVCATLPAAQAAKALKLPASAGVGQAAAETRCTYTWRQGTGTDEVGVELTARENVGAADPEAALTAVVGAEAEAVEGVGDAAAMDRSGRYGFGSVMFAAVQRTDRGIVVVTVAGRSTLGTSIYTTLAKELLARL